MKRQWIRLYTSVLNDPKILVLPDRLFRFWVNCLLTCGLSGDSLPIPSRLKISMRISERQTIANLKSLAEFGLIEETPDGWRMHDWKEYQYDSDSSTDRVKRFRNAQRNVTATEQSRAEQIQKQKAELLSSTEGVLNRPGDLQSAAASPARSLANGSDPIQTAFNELAAEGRQLPSRYLKNEYGREERNPASERLDAAIRRAEPRIRAARMPVAFAKKVILDALKGA